MRVISSGKSDIGQVRAVNQDAFILNDELGFYAVADGMGGHAAGEVAARESVEAAVEMICRGKKEIDGFRENPITADTSHGVCRLVESALQSATYLVYGIAEQKPNYYGMGTTFSALLIVGEYAITGQVGDTRVYRIRDGESVQLTEDHTLVNWQIAEGIITPEEAEYSPHKNVITRAVGNKDFVEVDTQIVSIAPGDRFLICSDGLHGYVDADEISDVMKHEPIKSCEVLIEMANSRGGRDNITAVVLEIQP